MGISVPESSWAPSLFTLRELIKVLWRRLCVTFPCKFAFSSTLRKWTATSLYKLLAELIRLDIWFNSECLRRGLMPNYVSEATPHLRLPKMHLYACFTVESHKSRYIRVALCLVWLKRLDDLDPKPLISLSFMV